MLHVSRFTPDPARHGAFIASLWQGPVPDDLRLRAWLYLDGEPRSMLLIWEGGDTARRYVEERFAGFGELRSETAFDNTPGLQACFERDLEGFGRWLGEARGATAEEVRDELSLRSGGLHATSFAEARRAGELWQAGREGSAR